MSQMLGMIPGFIWDIILVQLLLSLMKKQRKDVFLYFTLLLFSFLMLWILLAVTWIKG